MKSGINSSLLRWLYACDVVETPESLPSVDAIQLEESDEVEEGADPSVADWQEAYVVKLKALLANVFPEAFAGSGEEEPATLSGLIHILVKIHHRSAAVLGLNSSSNSDVLNRVLELSLCALLESEVNEACIHRIMTMDEAEQAELMQIIQQTMDQLQDLPSIESVEEKSLDHLEDGTSSHFAATSSQEEEIFYKTNESSRKRIEHENEVLKDENSQIQEELSQLKRKCESLQQENQHLISTLQETIIRQDMTLKKDQEFWKDEMIFKLKEKDQALEESNKQIENLQRSVEKITELNDELDLLRPTSDKVCKLEALVDKYKNRLEEASEKLEKSKHLEDLNKSLLSKNIALEAQVQTIAPLMSKLDKYKATCTDLEVSVSEKKEMMQKLASEVSSLTKHTRDLEEQLREYQECNSDLRQRLDMSAFSNTITPDLSMSVGACGESELNPEIAEKITRLEFENKDLRARLSTESQTHVDSLDDALDNERRLKVSFETKYFQTSATLNATKLSLEVLENEHATLKSEAEALQENCTRQSEEIKDLIALGQQLKQSEERYRENLAHAEKKYEETCHLHKLTMFQLQENAEAQAEISLKKILELEENRQTLENEMQAMKHLHLATMETQLGEWQKQRESMEEQNFTMLQKMEKEHKDAEEKLQHHFSIELGCKITELNMLGEELDSFKRSHSVSNEKHEQQRSDLLSKNAELMESLGQVQSSLGKERIENQLSIAGLEREKAELEEAKEKLERCLEAVQFRNESLEVSISQVESKVRIMEKERTHLTKELARKRDLKSFKQSMSLQADTQLNILRQEFKELQQDHRKLLEEHCYSEAKVDVGNSELSDVSRQMDNLKKVELCKQQEADKRRELVLVNSQLVQEKQQLLSEIKHHRDEKLTLQQKLNSLLLKEERRSKALLPRGVPDDNPSLGKENFLADDTQGISSDYDESSSGNPQEKQVDEMESTNITTQKEAPQQKTKAVVGPEALTRTKSRLAQMAAMSKRQRVGEGLNDGIHEDNPADCKQQ